MPGTVSACVVSSPLPTQTPANPFGVTSTTAPTALSSAALLPIVYWYGHSDPKRNQPVMEKSIQNIAKAVKERMSYDAISQCFRRISFTLSLKRTPFLAYNSGLFIDTPSTFSTSVRVGSEMRYPFIEKCVEEFGGW